MLPHPEIKLLDCTIRDGGLTNDSHFSLDTVRDVYQAACLSGIDYIELGYRNSKQLLSSKTYGPWRFCDEDQLQKVVTGIDKRNTKISIMQDAHKAVPEDIFPKAQSVVDMIRIATYVRDIDKAICLANNATEKGYTCTINIMAISEAKPNQLDEVIQRIATQTNINAVVIVDSYGALYRDDVFAMIDQFRQVLKTTEIGVHFHNSQQLAYANTIDCISKGVHYVDGTLFGLGRGAGNCPIEMLVAYLKDPTYQLSPLLKVIQNRIIPLKHQIKWGYHIPYMLSGMLNIHPQKAMDWMNHHQDGDLIEFYNQLDLDL